jgi:thiol-disulfide isomerase/thioredoxin
MKKIITGFVLTIFFLAITLIVVGIGNKLNKGKIIREHISKLPQFSFATLQNTSFNSSSIIKGPVLIVWYHPDCEHCQYEISEILESKIAKSNCRILLISDADRNDINDFLSQFNISEKPGIITLLDTASVFNNVFGADIIPSNYIYDRELNLVKILHGEYKIETFLKYIDVSE